ncbi:DNA-(apurinic or apyrimidinic site) lyase [Scopulibacillus darangshiensis]|uniref:Formamidopyrimidine-DNA glycosylase n=1 Tax=Scopulibacillus darangshiensis TaxID=442528 RepID=A0A4R2PAJ9_9BACL|nr:DNA-formamidopyrimidine glycosylase [Scopulibacillus darangshiensis]TCP32100.1 DNA-(apurinic or apyrimidinic site) lyase [Scopulibacillus darangshiensis]
MPELPEVETVKETLNKLVTDKTIGHVDVRWPNIIQRPDDIKAFQMLLEGQTIDTIARRGKFLLFYLDDYVLVSHLRMEGKYRLEEQDTPIDKHTHVIFRFSDGTELRYRDVRKFGTMHLFNKGEEFNSSPLRQLGPEPLSDVFTSEYLYSKCQKTERTIKQVLLDQTIVVGLGNIYVDEALFCARLHPLTKAKHLSAADSERLYASIQETLREAVGLGGSTIRTYLNSQGEMGMFQQRLNVYGRQGDSCPNCGTPIEKIKAGGRGTHFCPVCQNRGDGK